MMTAHVLHAGDGYTYLTRQVASDDVARERGQSLSDYYLQHGNPPGEWIGAGLESLEVSGQVTEAQMKALFGEGLHPNADSMIRAAVAGGATPEQAIKDARLGRRFPVYEDAADDPFPERLAAAYEAFSLKHDRSPEAGAERDELRWQTAAAILAEQGEGRAPESAAIARYLAKRGAEQRKAVAGYDLVFTPVKSVSTLWGLSDSETREAISTVHREAWREALEWVQSEAALTRVGAAGVAQIETHGLVAAAFDHLDSRAGDPNLHTHVAVSNKVQGVDGKWRSLDGRTLHALAVAASERYNTAVEQKMSDRLGVRFVPESRGGKRPVREIAGVDVDVRQAFSQRRGQVEAEYEKLLADYRREHGREAPREVQFELAQQATLSTRQGKEAGVGLRERLPQWRATAAAVLGGQGRVDEMVRDALAGAPTVAHPDAAERQDRKVETLGDLAETVLEELANRRATWNEFHVAAEASRVVRDSRWAEIAPPGADLATAIDLVVERALGRSLQLTPEELNAGDGVLTRSDGASIYTQHGSRRYTSSAVLSAEEKLLTAATSKGGLVLAEDVVDEAIAQLEKASGRTLNEGQAALARSFASDGARVVAGIGPAGAGKTTAMSAFARAVELGGGRVLALAPSSAAAAVLGDELAVRADTLDKLIDVHRRAAGNAALPEAFRIDEQTVLLVDEAGMAGTANLAALLSLAEEHGASIRLLGDPSQLNAVGAGGVLRLIERHVGAVGLTEVHRFRNADGSLNEQEAAASLQIRDGIESGLDFYIDGDRVRGGTSEAMQEEIYAAWAADVAAGDSSIMIASTNGAVVRLNTRAREDRIAAGVVRGRGVDLHDGSAASVGDVIVTRHNDRRLRVGRTDWVRNGNLWRVTRVHKDGALSAVNQETRVSITLPPEYVSEWVELGYAATINRVQGLTVDTQHGLIDGMVSRNQLYTANTRGRYVNRMYVVVDEALDLDLHEQPDPARAIRHTLEGVLARTGEEPGGLESVAAEWDAAHSLAQLVPAYQDAYTRLLEPVRLERYEQALRAKMPDLVDAILADDAWPVLAERMAAHEATGVDIAQLLPDRASARELDTARSVAQVLHWRLGEPDRVLDGPRLPAWIMPPPEEIQTGFATGPVPVSATSGTVPVDAAAAALPTSTTPGFRSNAADVEGPAVELVDAAAAPSRSSEHARAIEIHAAAWEFWQLQAQQPDAWTRGHLQERQLENLEHGWAPSGWTVLTEHLRAQGFRDQDLVAAGVATTTRDGRTIDRFRDRLVVPIRNAEDQVVGVTARRNPEVVDDNVPKYLNTPASDAYSKSELLLGWSTTAAAKIRDGATVVFVEGPMDLAAIDSLGREDVVALAPCGTALTDQQLQLVRDAGGNLARQVVFAFDGDKAGQTAAQRAWVRLSPEEAAGARYLHLPPGADPADLVKGGQSSLLGMALQGSGSLTEALVDQVIAAADMNRIETRVATARNIAESIARLPQALELDFYVTERLGEHLDPDVVRDLLREARKPESTTEETRPRTEPRADVDQVAPVDVDAPAVTEAPAIELDPDVREWLQRQAVLIEDRLDALVADVEGPTPPSWALELRQAPEDLNGQAAWRAAVRDVVAYRDRYQVTGDRPLGSETDVVRGVQKDAYEHASRALTLLERPEAQPARPAAEVAQIAQERRDHGREQLVERAAQVQPPLTPQERLERARQQTQQRRTQAPASKAREETPEQRQTRLAREAADRARQQQRGPQR